MTNLRLPGQYDERLLASVGLQGPYYNWNRWYLPSVGRYLELDPIARAGGLNAANGVDWYNYAEGNPLRWVDIDASQVSPAVPVPSIPLPANVPMIPPAANGPMAGGAGGAAAGGVAGAVVGGLAISAGATWLICATTGNYYYFCEYWFPHAGPRKRGNQDPPWTQQPPWDKPFNPGRGPGGDCIPCGPGSPTWTHGDGTIHNIRWDQDEECECFPKRTHVKCEK